MLDFGIAKAQHPFGDWKGGTRTGALIGTPQYMSPEQAQGAAIDKTSDLWALGVIAFECVCGRLPFPSEKPGELILQICAKPIPMPSQIARVPPRFDAWFARACQRDPAARFASAKELADTLADVLGAPPPADVSGAVSALSLPLAVPSGPAGTQLPRIEDSQRIVAPPLAPAAALAAMSPAAAVPVPLPPPRPAAGAPAQGAAAPGSAAPVPDHLTTIPLPSRALAEAAIAEAARRASLSSLSSLSSESEPATLVAPRGLGTMSGGAVLDSDPATLLALSKSRSKKAVAAVVARCLRAPFARRVPRFERRSQRRPARTGHRHARPRGLAAAFAQHRRDAGEIRAGPFAVGIVRSLGVAELDAVGRLIVVQLQPLLERDIEPQIGEDLHAQGLGAACRVRDPRPTRVSVGDPIGGRSG